MFGKIMLPGATVPGAGVTDFRAVTLNCFLMRGLATASGTLAVQGDSRNVSESPAGV
jgi:hypothetical protein